MLARLAGASAHLLHRAQAYSSWPTYPQLYAAGELVGGCDLLLELQSVGDLTSTIDEALAGPPQNGHASLQDRLRQLTTASPVMLFMKVCALALLLQAAAGLLVFPAALMSWPCQTQLVVLQGTPSEPRCGFSRRVAGALAELKVPFGSFDILQDDEIRQGLKVGQQQQLGLVADAAAVLRMAPTAAAASG